MSIDILHVSEAISDFMDAYSDFRVEMSLKDHFVDPIEYGSDVSIRIADLADASLIAR